MSEKCILLLIAIAACVKSYEVEVVDEARILGEGPHWDAERQELYFVDIFNASIVRYVPSENVVRSCKIGDAERGVSIVIPAKGRKDEFVATRGKDLVAVTWDGVSESPERVLTIATVDNEPGKEENRFNDGKVDPTGRLWVGTMGKIKESGEVDGHKGSLYSFPAGQEPVRHVEGVQLSNGLAWSSDLTRMYYIDSPTRRVDVFDFDAVNGTVSNRREFFDVGKHVELAEGGGPDGMTIDTNGDLWVALWGGAGVAHVDGRTGDLINKIDLPALQVTSVAFGGLKLDELYVTSAYFKMSDEKMKEFPKSGCTFRITGLGVTGLPGRPAEIAKSA